MKPPVNPHYRHEPTPFTITIPVLGIPVQFASNDPLVIDAVLSAFAMWTETAPDPDAKPVAARFLVHDRDEGGTRGTIAYRVPDDERVFIHTHGSLAISDPLRRDIVAYVTRELVNDREHFRYGVLEAATFAVLTQFDRQPFHAAAIVRGTSLLLLHGPSGSGKSTLTYTAMRAGFDILAEDMVYLQSVPRLRVWGVPSTIHLPAAARAHFPELEPVSTVRLANGKEKMAVRVPQERSARSPFYERAGICIVGARDDVSRIERVSSEGIEAVVKGRLEEGFDAFDATIGAPLRAIAALGGWRITMSSEPEGAVPLLHSMFDVLDAVQPVN